MSPLYLVYGNQASHATALPTRVLGTQAIGLVNPGPPPQAGASAAPQAFLASRSDLSFVPAGQAAADWTADQMAGGTYIFIYLPNGLCLASRGSAVRPWPGATSAPPASGGSASAWPARAGSTTGSCATCPTAGA